MIALEQFLFRYWRKLAVLLLAGAALGYHAHLQGVIEEARAERDRALLVADSVEAAGDTTRQRVLEVLGENTRWFERRIVQVREEKDSLDRELERVTRSRTELALRLEDVTATDTASVVRDSTGYRISTFEVYRPPYDVWARAKLPPPPRPGLLRIRIQLDSIPLGFRIGCGTQRDVRRAYVSVTAPEWAEIDVLETRQSPGVCNPRLVAPEPSWWERNDQYVYGAGGLLLGVWGAQGFPLPF